jgi:hypothetical protein
MPRYRFTLPLRAIGGYRLPEAAITVGDLVITPADASGYTLRVDQILADDASRAYEQAQQRAQVLFSCLALLGEGAAFVLGGREGVRARNQDLEEHPVSPDQSPSPFESIGRGNHFDWAGVFRPSS